MQIFIKSFDGKNITVSCNNNDSASIILETLKNKQYTFDNLSQHKFLYQSRPIQLDKSISENNITDLSTIYWYIRTRTGNCQECGH